MSSRADYLEQEEYQNRVRKLSELRKGGVDPYPAKYEPTHTSVEVQALGQGWHASSEEAATGQTVQVKMFGRLVLFRAMGKNAFAHLQDDLGRVQVMCNRELTKFQGFSPLEEESSLKWMEKLIDLGDILGVEGHLFYTQKGELTIYAKSICLLCKTLLPLPDKHSGLADKELRYRKRWLDLICHSEVTERLKRRSILLREIRHYFEEFSFLEVETPILQSVYGGAEARPFVTRLHALDQEMFMRISLEIPLKKLLVGGLPKVYEIGKVFRNEGIDRYHNPEFTLLEAYAACWDYRDMMSFVENLFERLALKLFGTTALSITCPQTQEKITLEMKAPWKRMSMKESLAHYAAIEVDSWSDEEIRSRLEESGHVDNKKLQALSRGLLIAALFEVFVEPHLIQPHHIIDHPIETTPLCKWHRDPEKRAQGLVERFETFIFRHEMCNSYSELNDPLLQRELLEEQALRRERGDEEAAPLDEEFLEAICQGMPPAGGIGIGLDRLVMLFTDAFSIRDVLYFPWMKPHSFGSHDPTAKS